MDSRPLLSRSVLRKISGGVQRDEAKDDDLFMALLKICLLPGTKKESVFALVRKRSEVLWLARCKLALNV